MSAPQSVPLKTHLIVAIVAPLVTLVLLGGILAWEVSRMSGAADWVAHTDAVMAKTFELRARLGEKESALRAWILSSDRALLGPYEQAATEATLTDLEHMTLDNPSQQSRLAELRTVLTTWSASADRALAGAPEDARADRDALNQRVRTLDRARTLLDDAVAAELVLLHDRQRENESVEQTAKVLFAVLLALAGAMIAFVSRRQLGAVSKAFETLVDAERAAKQASADREWLSTGQAAVGSAVVGERSVAEVAAASLDALCAHTGAVVGAVYHARGKVLVRVAAQGAGADVPAELPIDEGQAGRALSTGATAIIRDAEPQLVVGGGVASRRTIELALVPIRIEGRAIGLVELGFTTAAPPLARELLPSAAPTMGLALRAADQRARLQELLEETQRQGEELQTQHEELRVTNEELEHQGQALREAHGRQESTQHELEAVNSSLEEQTSALEAQREELLAAKKALEARARELQLASQYKSEFLARMSHELRTPLNSSLILARLLADNPAGNLDEEQVRFANTIHAAGTDLLLLINDILDLAKIEAGRLELRLGQVAVDRLRDSLTREFEQVARGKGLGFSIRVMPGAPAQLYSDDQRIVQVLRNLLSNACKFTERGEVTLDISSVGDRVRFAVTDTGIGIPADQAERVFEAFHQVDGSVARRHGGTGLGLAISRDLAALLGGTLELDSEVGRGSTFALTIPIRLASAPATPSREPPPPMPARPTVPSAPAIEVVVDDDRGALDPSRRRLLVIEDDVVFGGVLRDLAHELDFQVLVSTTADGGIDLAQRYRPDGILLDVKLPDHSGLTVLERLKRQPALRHIPIHMLSVDDHAQRALELGAVGYLLKPATRAQLAAAIGRIEDRTARRVRRLLIVEDDVVQAEALAKLLGGGGVEIATVGTIAGALEHLSTTTFDCVVMDLRLADGTGFQLLERMTADDRITFPPVIVHTGKALTDDEEALLRQFSASIIVKGARSPDRLVDEVALFLHQVEADMPPERQKLLRAVRDREAIFEGKRVLIVEDDIRNVFALTAILEPRGLHVTVARNGREALAVLDRDPIHLVLMDVMMPEMDGIEATRRIRAKPSKIPIIALTAKAMADDREACLAAGANDYLAKPIDVDMLLSLLRVWMPR